MKKKIILIIIIISFVLLFATIILYQENKSFSSVDISSDALIVNENETDWQWVEKQKKLYELTPIEIDLLLKELRERFPDKDERLKAIAVLRLGTPYQLGCWVKNQDQTKTLFLE